MIYLIRRFFKRFFCPAHHIFQNIIERFRVLLSMFKKERYVLRAGRIVRFRRRVVAAGIGALQIPGDVLWMDQVGKPYTIDFSQLFPYNKDSAGEQNAFYVLPRA